jgi:hypothetical protein
MVVNLGFGSLRTQKGQFGQTYAKSSGCTLLSILRTYALQTVHADVRMAIGRTLLFEYPLVNT